MWQHYVSYTLYYTVQNVYSCQFLIDGWECSDMCPILHAFPCQSDEATLQSSSLQCRLQGMRLHLSAYGKSISIWPETVFWYIIMLCGASFSHWDQTLTSITLICNNSKLFPISVSISLTFVDGDAHIDRRIIMREAFGWRVSSCVASWDKGPQSRTNSELLNYFLGLVFWSADTADAALSQHLLDNAFNVVCLLSYSMCVNQKPQWVEGCREMDIDVM